MEDYIKLTVKLFSKQIIIHCITNKLTSRIYTVTSRQYLETIAKNIIKLAKNIKADATKVAILGIIPRRDTFNIKAQQVNDTLKKDMRRRENSIHFESW